MIACTFLVAFRALAQTPVANAPQPFGGTPWPIPGLIFATNYDLGGMNVGFFDNQKFGMTHNPYDTHYRADNIVHIVPCVNDPVNNGFAFGEHGGTGNWMNYTVSITETGDYTIQVRYLNGHATISHFQLDLDEAKVCEPIAIPATGGWGNAETLTVTGVKLQAGRRVLRITVLDDGADGAMAINWLNFIYTKGGLGAPSITSSKTAIGAPGQPFNFMTAATNSPVKFILTGELPAGLIFNPATGVISGIPTNAGASTVSIVATNDAGASQACPLSIAIGVEPPPPGTTPKGEALVDDVDTPKKASAPSAVKVEPADPKKDAAEPAAEQCWHAIVAYALEDNFSQLRSSTAAFNQKFASTRLALSRADDVKFMSRYASEGSNLAKGAAGWWKFDESSGTVAADASGQRNAAALNQSTWIHGIRKGALEFDGKKTYALVNHAASLQFGVGDAMTICAWIKPTAIKPTGQTIAIKGRTGHGTRVNYCLRIRDKRVEFYYRNLKNSEWHTYETSADTIEPNTWVHIAVTLTFGKGNSIKLYVNGNEKNGTWEFGNGNEPPSNSAEPIWFGAESEAAKPDELFTGALDDIRIYRRILSMDELNMLYRIAKISE